MKSDFLTETYPVLHAALTRSHVDTFSCLTCDRSELLSRSLASYFESAPALDTEIAIFDDSKTRQSREKSKSALRSFSGQHNCKISYAGFEEKLLFAKKLLDAGRIPSETVKFALFGNGVGGTSVGANRNAMLLHTIGNLGVCIDDDIVCRLYTVVTDSAENSLDTGKQQLDKLAVRNLWSFSSRQALFEHVMPGPDDFLAPHETVLGLPASQTLKSLKMEQGSDSRVALTLTGFAGDCAWESPAPLLFTRGESFRRLTSSEAVYRAALTHREQVQVARDVVITECGDDTMAGCMGYDHTRFLPPFLPNGRGEEAFFGSMLAKCFGPVQIAHLPVAALHAPPETRVFSPLGFFRPNLTVLMVASFCVSTCEFGSCITGIDKLHKAGMHLREIGEWTNDKFVNFIGERATEYWGTLIRQLEVRLESEGNQPSYWAHDVDTLLKLLRDASVNQKPFPVVDFGLDGNLAGSYESAKSFVRKLGNLLIWWPQMIETAKILKDSGITVGAELHAK